MSKDLPKQYQELLVYECNFDHNNCGGILNNIKTTDLQILMRSKQEYELVNHAIYPLTDVTSISIYIFYFLRIIIGFSFSYN
jgi:hypothetical protein